MTVGDLIDALDGLEGIFEDCPVMIVDSNYGDVNATVVAFEKSHCGHVVVKIR